MRDIFCDREVIKNFDQVRNELKLVEEGNNQEITIGGIPNDAVLIKLDVDRAGYKKRSAYLRTGFPFIHMGCDYCLILPTSNQIVLFELKSNNPKGYVEQFIAAELFMQYCSNLWNSYNRVGNNNFVFIKVLISSKYNSTNLTAANNLPKLRKPDRCGNEMVILSPGFPHRLRLEKILRSA